MKPKVNSVRRRVATKRLPMYEPFCINFFAIGQKLKAERERLGCTQEQVAEAIEITPAFVGHIERGERSMSLEKLIKFCNFYHVTIDYLLSDTLPPREEITGNRIAFLLKDKNPKQQAAILDMVKTLTRYI